MYKHTVITMTDSNYFPNGELLIKTRKRVDARFICYGCELTEKQLSALRKNDIQHRPIDRELFTKNMNTLKFNMMLSEVPFSNCITFVDFDTYFIKDWWKDVFKNTKFQLGITVRNHAIQKMDMKCAANGGVIFCRGTIQSKLMLQLALKTIEEGSNKKVPWYDKIWKTLEDPNRPPEKRKMRTDKSWWTDQVFLSALVWKYLDVIRDPVDVKSFYFMDYELCMFDCNRFNNVDSNVGNLVKIVKKYKPYIMHLKNQNRDELKEYNNLARIVLHSV